MHNKNIFTQNTYTDTLVPGSMALTEFRERERKGRQSEREDKSMPLESKDMWLENPVHTQKYLHRRSLYRHLTTDSGIMQQTVGCCRCCVFFRVVSFECVKWR